MPKFREILDVLKNVKHSTPKPVFCPACKNPDLKQSDGFGIVPQKYLCEKCGYEGHLVLELDEETPENHRV